MANPRERARGRTPTGGNAIRAYVIASGLTGLLLGLCWTAYFTIDGGADYLPAVLRIVLVALIAAVALPALPAWLVVSAFLKHAKSRGRADAFAGAAIGFFASIGVFLYFEGAFAEFKSAVTPRAIAGVIGFWLLPNTIAGAFAGWLYWRLARRAN